MVQPIPELYGGLHGSERETTVTAAQDAVLDLLDRIRRAERDPIAYRRFERWQRLQREVDWILEREELLPDSEPETLAIAQSVAEWIQQETLEDTPKPIRLF